MNMKRICGRTDLAIESITEVGEGIRQYQRGEAFKITEIEISEDRYGEQFGKKKGRYITLENGNLGFPSEDFRKMAEELAEEIKKLVPCGKILIAGLGNDDITRMPWGWQRLTEFLRQDTLKTSSEKRNQMKISRDLEK